MTNYVQSFANTSSSGTFTNNTLDATTTLGTSDTAIPTQNAVKTYVDDNNAWTTFTPTWANVTVGNGTSRGAYKKQGRTVHFWAELTLGNTTTIDGSVSITLPVAYNGLQQYFIIGTVNMLAAGAAWYTGKLWGYGQLYSDQVSGSYVVAGGVDATHPNTFTTNDHIYIEANYEAA